MLSHFTHADLFLWFTSMTGEAILLAILFWREVYCEHECFTAYILFKFIKSMMLLFIAWNMDITAYFWAYWIGLAFNFLFTLGVAFAIYNRLFSEASLQIRKHFYASIILFTSGAVFLGVFRSQGVSNQITAALLTLDRSASVFLLLLFLILAVYAREFRAVPDPSTRAILTGFGVYLTVYCARAVMVYMFTETGYWFIRYIHLAGYILALIAWSYLLFKKQDVKVPMGIEGIRIVKNDFNSDNGSVSSIEFQVSS